VREKSEITMPQDRVEQAREEALLLYQQGVRAQTLGDYPKAEDCYRRCHRMMKAIGNSNGEAAALHYMGTLLEARGDLDEARTSYEESFILFQQDQDFQNCVFSLFFQSMLALKYQDPERAIDLVGQALDLAFQLGVSYVQEGWSRIRQMAGVLFARRQMDALMMLGEKLAHLGKELEEVHGASSPSQRQLAHMTQQVGLFFLGCGRYWQPRDTNETFPAEEVVGWLLQTAVNLDQATGSGLAFTDLAGKVIQEHA
jgi:tetratricopeptide (TPR) repeat protein